jgi:hypothetical protein
VLALESAGRKAEPRMDTNQLTNGHEAKQEQPQINADGRRLGDGMVDRPARSGPKRGGQVTNVHKTRLFPAPGGEPLWNVSRRPRDFCSRR